MEWKRIKLYLSHRKKQIIALVLFGVCCAIIFSNLYDTREISMSSALQSKFNYFIIITIVTTIIHMIYLYILLDILIFQHPLDKKISLIKLLIPAFLVLAYVSNAIKSWAAMDISVWHWKDVFEQISFFCFFGLYIFWAINDKRHKNNAWFIIDIISIVGLFLILIFQVWISSSNDQLTQFILSPNGVVAFSVFMFVFLNWYSKLEKNGLDYKSFYGKYRENNAIVSAPTITIDFSSFSNGIKILDFGCGSGERFEEYKKWITWNKVPIQQITGFDKLSEYKAEFTTKVNSIFSLAKKKIFFKENITKKDFSNANLVILSHVTYDYKTVKKIIGYLKKCEAGTYILLRVCSPNSFFVPVSIAGANNIFSFKGNRGHLGYVWLNCIKKKAKLEEVEKYTVKQNYPIDDENKRKVISDLLKHLYDGYLAFYIEDYLSALSENNITTIPNDDLIFVLKKN